MKEQFTEWTPRAKAALIVKQANEIIEEFQADDFVLTLRQLYYQFVSKDLIPNTQKSYDKLGTIITKARLAGMIDWDAIEDRNRSLTSYKINADIPSIIRETVYDLWVDLWEHQAYYLEVWVEKDALGSVIERACNKYRVPSMACKGYLSASMAYEAGKRLEEQINKGKAVKIIHLGDHDPSGIDMTRDNQDRLDLFTRIPYGVEVDRIALTMPQIEEYAPPPNPAKVADPRAKDYVKRFGTQSWELDALKPSVLTEMISSRIAQCVDESILERALTVEQEKKDKLRKLSRMWHEIEPMLEDD